MTARGDAAPLVCPETKRPLREATLAEAESVIAAGRPLAPRGIGGSRSIGPTPTVLLRDDGGCAYPIVGTVPVLLVPEQLVVPGTDAAPDRMESRYAEAYEEMAFYNSVASAESAKAEQAVLPPDVERILGAAPDTRGSFPDPSILWLDNVYDAAAQWDVYRHISPLRGKRVLQLGGKGTHAIKFLLGGASEAWLVSPMIAESHFGLTLARQCGLLDRFHCAAGIAEELPFPDERFDVVYTGGCLHHMVTELALAECARVLRPGGRFGAVEPWRAPFYGVGTMIFGKREVDVHCRPLTAPRTRPLFETLRRPQVVHHGALTRYPMLALSKLGWTMSLAAAWRVTRLDDALSAWIPPLRGLGSSVSVLGTKADLDEA